MNIIELLKTLRIRDKDIADVMGVRVAQLNRRQKQIQQPSDESKTQLRNYAKDLIHRLQMLILEVDEETTIAPEQETKDSQETINEDKPQIEDIEELKPTTKKKK